MRIILRPPRESIELREIERERYMEILRGGGMGKKYGDEKYAVFYVSFCFLGPSLQGNIMMNIWEHWELKLLLNISSTKKKLGILIQEKLLGQVFNESSIPFAKLIIRTVVWIKAVGVCFTFFGKRMWFKVNQYKKKFESYDMTSIWCLKAYIITDYERKTYKGKIDIL